MISSMAEEAWRTRREWRIRGCPPSDKNCFGTGPPMRSPRPAAGTRATVRLLTDEVWVGLTHCGKNNAVVGVTLAPASLISGGSWTKCEVDRSALPFQQQQDGLVLRQFAGDTLKNLHRRHGLTI